MPRKEKIIVGTLVVAALAVIVWLILMGTSTGQKIINSGRNNQASNSANGSNAATSIQQGTDNFKKANSGPATPEAVARSFAERFGSFSNQSDFENIVDLYPFMTAKMRVWAENYITQAKNKASGTEPYFGITSKAVASKILEQGDSSATVQVSVSRRETGGATAVDKEYLQNINLALVKEAGNFWKVDHAEWQK